MTTPTPRRGSLLKRLSYKMADVDTKLERICVVTGNVEKLKALVKKKKDIYTTLLDGWTPLQVAAFNLKQEVVEHLLAQVGGLGNAIEEENGCTALHMLAWRGDVNLVRIVVEQGNASLSVRSKNDFNVLHYAVCGGSLPVVRYLLEMHAKHKAHSKIHGYTPFHLACKVGHAHIVRYFLEHTAQHVDSKDAAKCTGLYHACLEGHTDVVHILLKAGADRTKTNNLGVAAAAACRCESLYRYVMEWVPGADEPEDLSPILLKARAAMREKLCAPPLLQDDYDFEQVKTMYRLVASPSMPLFATVVKEPHDWVQSTLVIPTPVNPDINPAELLLQPGKSALKSGHTSPASSAAPSATPSPEPCFHEQVKRSISFSNKLEDVRYFKGKDKTSKVSRTRSKGELSTTPPPWLVMAAQGSKQVNSNEIRSEDHHDSSSRQEANNHFQNGESEVHQQNGTMKGSAAVVTPAPTKTAANVLAQLLTNHDTDPSEGSPESEDQHRKFIDGDDDVVHLSEVQTSEQMDLETEHARRVAAVHDQSQLDGVRIILIDELSPDEEEAARRRAETQAEQQRVNLFPAQLRAEEEELHNQVEEEHQPELKQPQQQAEKDNIKVEAESKADEEEAARRLAEAQAEEQRVNMLVAQVRAEEEARLEAELQEEYRREQEEDQEENQQQREERQQQDEKEKDEFIKVEAESKADEEEAARRLAEAQAEEQRVNMLVAQVRAEEEARLEAELQEEHRRQEEQVQEQQREEQQRRQDGEESKDLVKVKTKSEAYEEGAARSLTEEKKETALVNELVTQVGSEEEARHLAEWSCEDSIENSDHEEAGGDDVDHTSPVRVSDYLNDNDLDFPSTKEEKEVITLGVQFANELRSSLRKKSPSLNGHNTTSESGFSGVSGHSPPPSELQPPELGDWEYLNKCVRMAAALEESVPHNEVGQKLVDLRAVKLAGTLSKAIGSRSVRLIAKSFYFWKYEHVGGAATVGPVFKFIEEGSGHSATSMQSAVFTPGRSSRTSSAIVPSSAVSRLDAGMRFAIKVLDKHSRRMKEVHRLDCLAKAWLAWGAFMNNDPNGGHRALNFSELNDDYCTEKLANVASPLSAAAATGSGVYSSPTSEHKRYHAMASALSDADANADEGRCEEDLLRLGAMPTGLVCVFRANETVLWAMFTFYVQHKLLIPSTTKTSKNRNHSKRIMSIQALWTMLHDFGVCPTLCSKTMLNNCMSSLLQPGQLPSIHFPATSKLNQSEAMVSFHSFQKLLWVVARDCLDHAPVQWNPVLLLLKLFNHMDTSAGRRKMVAGSRDARLLPAFSLSDPSFHEEIVRHQKNNHRTYDCGDEDISPEKTPQATHLITSPGENASMATLLKQNYHAADTPLVPSRSHQDDSGPGSSGKAGARAGKGVSSSQSIEKKHQRNYVKAKISAHENAMKLR